MITFINHSSIINIKKKKRNMQFMNVEKFIKFGIAGYIETSIV